MVAGHYSRYTEEGLLPRAKALAQTALNMTGFMDSQANPSFGNSKFRAPGQSWFALVLDLPVGWELWCSSGSLSSWLTFVSLHSLCIFIHPSATMTRKRGRPRRGSAWYTHKEQRQRRKNLERALSMATSILRKRARADQLALHAIIAETGTERSSHTMAIEPGSSLEGGVADEFPTCYVEETSYLEELVTTLEPQAMAPDLQDGSGPKDETADEFPVCIVEEIPWTGDYSPTSHAEKATIEDEARDKACAERNVDETRPGMKEEAVGAGLTEIEARAGMNVEVGNEIFDDAGNHDLHGPFLRAEHLALVFELRGHMADQEHRALLMGQRLDLLLDAYSNAPAKRKCPFCAQPFAIPARSTWQTGKGDRSPGI
jgi:hypothetical protein